MQMIILFDPRKKAFRYYFNAKAQPFHMCNENSEELFCASSIPETSDSYYMNCIEQKKKKAKQSKAKQSNALIDVFDSASR